MFLIARDPQNNFRFAALQSRAAERELTKVGAAPPVGTPDSVIVIDRGAVLTRSDAAIAILRRMPWPWRLLVVARVLPRSLRDAIYSAVARNRYRWFGRRDQCMMPTPELRAKFLDDPKDQ